MGMIVGYEQEKQELATIREMLQHAEFYRRNGVRIPRGLLLSGDPGVGKTVLAKSISGDGIALVELRAATCCEDEAVEAVCNAFAQAKETAPAVLLLDELDKIAGLSGHFYMEDNDRIRKTLLQELDALSSEEDVLVVATCNDADCMSDELIRPGRFDRRIEISTPDEDTRYAILQEYFGRISAEKQFNLNTLAGNTRGFSGAKLECLANECGILALEKDVPSITEADVRTALNKLEFGANEKCPFEDFTMLHRVAAHEAGHAFAALFLCPDNLYGASVMPQGNSNGHIRFVPQERRVQSISEVETEAAVLLAGHVAERVILGEYLTGSSRDIAAATTRLYHLCVREAAYGYDTVLFGLNRGMTDLPGEMLKAKLARTVEEKLKELDARVERLIYDNPHVYSAVCHALEEKKTLTRDELLEIKKATAEAAAA